MDLSAVVIVSFVVAVLGAYALGWRGGLDWRDAQSKVKDENISERLRERLLLSELESELVEKYQKTKDDAARLVITNQRELTKRYGRGETNLQVLQEWFGADAILK